VDVHDDLKREFSFYEQTLASVTVAEKKFKKEEMAYIRPTDYFAEMMKSDEHMMKVKGRIMSKKRRIEGIESAKHRRWIFFFFFVLFVSFNFGPKLNLVFVLES